MERLGRRTDRRRAWGQARRGPAMAIAIAVMLLQPLWFATARAQEARGTIQGRVLDATGGIVPGATVEIVNTATGITSTALSNEEGNYRVPFLVPGTYRVSVSLAGFNRFVRDRLELHIADVQTVDATLTPGALTDEVLVTARAAGVDTASADLGQVVDARRIAELPIREGSPVELVILAPGVTNATNLRLRKAAFNAALSQFSTDGSGSQRNEFTIDGIPNTAGDRVAYSPPSAAIEEFKVQTTTYDSAQGFTSGAVVNLLTKSGSNSLHGQVYEWFRSSALNTRSYFDRRGGVPKRDYKDNRYGAAVGGPVKQNRTFFFANFEANPFQVPQPLVFTVPTAKQRNGDFSDLLALGPQYQIYDPATTRPHPTIAGRFVRDPFPGNIIPTTRFDPAARNILDYWPLPNQPGTVDGRDNYANPTARALETYYTATARVDHTLSPAHRIFGRFSWDFWEEEKDNAFDNLATGIFLNRKNRVLGLDDTYTVRSNLLTNVRAGFTRQLFPERRRSTGFDLGELGFSPTLLGLVPEGGASFPNIALDNFAGFGGWESGDGYFTTDVFSLAGSVLWLHGNHSVKVGTEFRRYVERSSRFPTDLAPRVTFGSTWTRGPIDNAAAAPMGQDLASFLLGVPTGGQMTQSAAYNERSDLFAVFLQDDWRIGNRLTLNLGVRYELEQPLREADNHLVSGFDFDTPLPIASTVLANYAAHPIPQVPVDAFQVRGGLLYPDTGGPRGAWSGRLSNVLPRAGMAFLLTPKTAFRGGYGFFAEMLGTNRMTVNQAGFSRTTTIVPSLDNGQTFVATLANPLPQGLLAPVGSGLGLMTDVGSAVTFPYLDDLTRPRVHRWSAGVQQDLPGKLLVEVTYVGAVGTKLPVTRQLNAVPEQYFSRSPVRDQAVNDLLTQAVPNPFYPLLPATALAGQTVARSQLLRPYPQFTSVMAVETSGRSDYHAVQTRVERRLADGFTAQAAYTWSRAMTETAFLNNFDARPSRVISPVDRTHVLVVSGLVELPFGRDRRWGHAWSGLTDTLLGGWQVSALFKAQSGGPLAFGNFLLKEGMTIDDVPLSGDARTFDRWFNVDAFERAPAQQLVSNVRTQPLRFAQVRGPGYGVLDLGLLKNLRLHERTTLQLRLEAYNALNRTNVVDPNQTPTSSAFGRITALNGMPREFQLAARLTF